MHEYIEIQFRRQNKPFPVQRQGPHGFFFNETDAPQRTIDIGFAPFDHATQYRMQRIRQIKGWGPQRFDVKVSVEDGSLVLRGDDRYSLPEGWYIITANVGGAKVRRVEKRRVEVVHNSHAVQRIDLELDERTIEVDLTAADPEILRVLTASTLDGEAGDAWLQNEEIRPTRRACALNLLATLRATPMRSAPLITQLDCLFSGLDDRCYARVSPAVYERLETLSDAPNNKVFAEGQPRAKIHELLIDALCQFDGTAIGCFGAKALHSFRAEGSPSLQMVIARPTTTFAMNFADLDLDLGNPLQDLVGLSVHLGELLDGKPTNHLDLRKLVARNAHTAPYVYYKVATA